MLILSAVRYWCCWRLYCLIYSSTVSTIASNFQYLIEQMQACMSICMQTRPEPCTTRKAQSVKTQLLQPCSAQVRFTCNTAEATGQVCQQVGQSVGSTLDLPMKIANSCLRPVRSTQRSQAGGQRVVAKSSTFRLPRRATLFSFRISCISSSPSAWITAETQLPNASADIYVLGVGLWL